MANGVVTIPISGQPLVCDPSLDGEHGNPVALNEFFAGPENLLVEPAVQSVLGRRSTRYNPLVLYGPSGTGKSHLARGIATAWKANSPSNRVVYITAVDFARQWADAIEAQAVEEFRADFRTADLVIVENLGELLGKPSAQEELVRTLDVVMRHDTQVVVTARVAPIALAELSTALQSRLTAGLAVPLAPPGPGARLAVLQRWARLRQVDLSEAILRVLADGLGGTVPELLSAMLQLELPIRQDGRKIDAQAVREFLAERDAQQLPLRDIAIVAARHFSLKLADLRGSSRRRPVVVARDVAMFLARMLTKNSLQQIGLYFGGRDHTTVLHACRKTEKLLQSDATIRQATEQLRRRLLRT